MKVTISPTIIETWQDYPDNESNAIAIYFYNCDHNCKDCHNPEFQKENINSKIITIEELIDTIYAFSSKILFTNKIVLSGGDPLHPKNIMFVKELCNKLIFDFQICIYTGYNVTYAIKNELKAFTFLKCGKYKQELKQESKKTDKYISFASTNQELYNNAYKKISTNGIYLFE